MKTFPKLGVINDIALFILNSGNPILHHNLFVDERDGFVCKFKDKIEFNSIRSNFDLPNYIELDEKSNSIYDKSSWSIVIGGLEGKMLREEREMLWDIHTKNK